MTFRGRVHYQVGTEAERSRVGEKGTILVSDVSSPRIVPESKMKAFERPKPFIPRVKDHKIEWLESIRTGKPASSSFTDYSGHLAEVVLLGNLAVRTGRKIEWDGENLKARNCPEADRYIRREYRKGWQECCLPAERSPRLKRTSAPR